MKNLRNSPNDVLSTFEKRVSDYENKIAYKFINSDQDHEILSYGDFRHKTGLVAAYLLEVIKLKKNDRVLILYPPGIEYLLAFYGCVFSGIIAVPAYPPDYKNSSRVSSIIKDCKPTVILTTQQMITQMAAYSDSYDFHACYRDKMLSLPDLSVLERNFHPKLDASNLSTIAFLQYTSGSTSSPKGVVVTHHNLIANTICIENAIRLTSKGEIVSWLPPYHDMGLIGCIIYPLVTGISTTLMSPYYFVKKPVRWLECISQIQTTERILSAGPNFSYELCNNKINDDVGHLDLSRWQLAVCGSEPIKIETYEKFSRKFESAGFKASFFVPVYGLAEATLLVSGHASGKAPTITHFDKTALIENKVAISEDIDIENNSQRLMGCGVLIKDHNVLIVDPLTLAVCKNGTVGEIWLQGKSVAEGYWHNGENTSEEFNAYTLNKKGPYLRTGDMGFIHNHELYISGRLKDCIIINGKNYYPQDIEQTVSEGFQTLRENCTAVFKIEASHNNGPEEIVVVQEIVRLEKAACNFKNIASTIRSHVFKKHHIPLNRIIFIEQSSIPKTSSGKIQRQKTRQLFLEDKLRIIHISDLYAGQ